MVGLNVDFAQMLTRLTQMAVFARGDVPAVLEFPPPNPPIVDT